MASKTLQVARLEGQRRALRVVVPLRNSKVTTKSGGGETLREGVNAAELTERIVSEMVGRDGIEPPTPGFSVLFPRSCKCAQLFDVERRAYDEVVRRSALECARESRNWAQFGHKAVSLRFALASEDKSLSHRISHMTLRTFAPLNCWAPRAYTSRRAARGEWLLRELQPQAAA